MEGFAEWLQATPLSVTLQSVAWVVPLVQSIHILMIGVVFASILMIALRVLGLARADEEITAVVRRFAPWMWAGLAVMATTGLILVIAEPVRELMNFSFRLKMALLALGVASALAFRGAIGRSPRAGAGGAAAAEASAAAKSAAVATVALWLAIIFLGRAIAYDIEVWGALSPAAGGAVDLTSFAESVYASGVGEWMRTSLKALPIVNAIHVMALATVFGTIFVVDLRLLGYPGTARPYTRIAREMLPWTWGAFLAAAVTGALMFAANAITYVDNTAFRLKMLVLLAAGANMAVFQLVTVRSVAAWDTTPPPLAARAAGGLSMLFWTSVIVLGRVIGFTKGYDFEIPEELDFDFSALGNWVLGLGDWGSLT